MTSFSLCLTSVKSRFILRVLRDVNIVFCSLFPIRIANIETATVTGNTKHAHYEIGDTFDAEKHSGTWSAVFVNGSWHLLDVAWSSKAVSGVQSNEWLLLDDNGTGAR